MYPSGIRYATGLPSVPGVPDGLVGDLYRAIQSRDEVQIEAARQAMRAAKRSARSAEIADLARRVRALREEAEAEARSGAGRRAFLDDLDDDDEFDLAECGMTDDGFGPDGTDRHGLTRSDWDLLDRAAAAGY